MKRRTLIISFAIGILLLGVNIYDAYLRHQAGTKQSLANRLVPIHARDAIEFDLQVKSRRVFCKKQDDGRWWVQDPYLDLASRKVIANLKAFLLYGHSSEVEISSTKAGLDTPKAELIIRSMDDGERVSFGIPSGDGKYIYAGISSQPGKVFLLKRDLLSFLELPDSSFRENSLTAIPADQVSWLMLKGTKSGNILIKREVGGWELAEPIVARADMETVNKLLTRALQMRAEKVSNSESSQDAKRPGQAAILISGIRRKESPAGRSSSPDPYTRNCRRRTAPPTIWPRLRP